MGGAKPQLNWKMVGSLISGLLIWVAAAGKLDEGR